MLKTFVLLFILAIGLSSITKAQSCNQTVIDESGVFRDNASLVEESAKELAKLGADVKIRTFKTIGDSGNLPNHIAKLQAQCPSWQNGNGGKKANLIIIAHSRQEKMVVILSGSDWKTPIDANYNRIISEVMRPYFKTDNHSRAFINAMSEIKRIIETPVPTPTISTQPNEQSDSGWLSKLLTFSLGGSLLAVIALALVRWRQVRMSNISSSNELQNSGILLKQQLVDRLIESESEIKRLGMEIGLQSSPSLLASLSDELAAVELRYKSVWTSFNQYEPGTTTIQVEDRNLPVGTYRQLTDAFNSLHEKLDEIDAEKNSLELKIPKVN